jgi:methylated-DNA-[protein]-cysteine S-methyltransferase
VTTYYLMHPSAVGELMLVADEDALTGMHFMRGRQPPAPQAAWVMSRSHPVLQQAQDELDAYFRGRLRRFTVPLAPQGTAFQLRAWDALARIPFGETRTYGEQAVSIGQPSATRAVGMANGRNPIGIIIPCHRVIGAGGALTGFGGGLEAKRYLLALEQSSFESNFRLA